MAKVYLTKKEQEQKRAEIRRVLREADKVMEDAQKKRDELMRKASDLADELSGIVTTTVKSAVGGTAHKRR